jgi:uncharacterized protein (DUF305 family)
MSPVKIIRRPLLACAAAILSFTTLATASMPAPNEEQRRFEIRFMTDMIDHHAMAVMTAQLCLERAVHAELRAACEQILESQLEEIVTLQMWLSDWYGIEHQPAMNPGMHHQMEKLAATSGAQSEIEFMKMMIRHHWMAVIRAQQCQNRAFHVELIGMCEDIETEQLAEIAEMGTWLCEWYQICGYHRQP